MEEIKLNSKDEDGSNNSFNRSADSVDFVVNLSVSILNACPVNSGVRRLCFLTGTP